MSARRLKPVPSLAAQREVSAQALRKADVVSAVLPIALAALTIIGLAHLLGALRSMSALHEYGSDFSAYFAAALALRAHPQANIYDLHVLAAVAQAHQAAVPTVPYLYPPTLAVLVIPLTFLPYGAALTLWTAGNTLLWLVATALMVAYLHRAMRNDWRATSDTAGSHPSDWRSRLCVYARLDLRAVSSLAIATFLSFTYAPIAQGVALGQITVLVFFIVTLIPWLQRREADAWAGVLLGVATVLKLFPAVLIVYCFMRGRRRIVAGALISIAALVVLTALATGLDGLAATRFLLINGDANALQFHNQSLARVPLWIGVMLGHAPQDTPSLVGYILVGLVAAIFGFGLWQQRRVGQGHVAKIVGKTAAAEDLLGYCWALATMVLVAPITWMHYDAWLLPPIIFCLGWALAEQSQTASGVAKRASRWLLVGTIAAYVVTMNGLPFSYDGLTTFSPGPYIDGHAMRPFFMLLRPAGAVLIWLVCGYLFASAKRMRVAGEDDQAGRREAESLIRVPESPGSIRTTAATALALLFASLAMRLVVYAVALAAHS